MKENKNYLTEIFKTDYSLLYLSLISKNEEIIIFLIKENILLNEFDFENNNNKLNY